MIRTLPKLITAHIDAWGTTFIIGAVCLWMHDDASAAGWLLVIAVTVGYWLGFAVNDYHDAPFDALDPRKGARNFFAHVTLSPARARLIVALILLALALPFLNFGWRGLAVYGLALLILWAYSAPPLRLKSVPGFDVVTHALFVQTFPYVIPLVLLDFAWLPFDYVIIPAFLLASTASQLEQQVRDYEVDRRTERNFTTLVGRGTSALLVKIVTTILTLHLIINIVNGIIPAQFVPFALISLPIALHRLVRGAHQPRSEWLFRVTVVTALGYAAILLIRT